MSITAAIFDVDGTLVRADVVDYYLFLVREALPRGQKWLRYLGALFKAPYWAILDKIDRARFNRSFYRSYRGLAGKAVAQLGGACFENVQSRRLITETVRRLEEHRSR